MAATLALFLFAQLAALAHCHPDVLTRDASRSGQITVTAGLCPLCLLEFHTPASSSPAPTLQTSYPVRQFSLPKEHPGYHSLPFRSSQTRAPPASL